MISIIKFGKMNWTVHVLFTEDIKNVFFLMETGLERNVLFKLVLNNRMWRCKLVSMTQEMNMSQNLLNTVMRIRIPQKSMQHLETS